MTKEQIKCDLIKQTAIIMSDRIRAGEETFETLGKKKNLEWYIERGRNLFETNDYPDPPRKK